MLAGESTTLPPLTASFRYKSVPNAASAWIVWSIFVTRLVP